MTLTIERQQFAEQNEMSMEFVNWFFDEKKEGCGNAWFIMAAAMWEGWKGRDDREVQPVMYASEETLAYAKEGEKSLVTWSEPMGDAVIPLYTAPPAPAVVKLPTEFYSDEGIVVRLEEVMAALAVAGVQYERKANAKTRCEFPASEVPEEMTGGIAMSKYKVKKSNYAQWVKGWNACRAAMLAQPVSQRYTLPPHVYRELVNSLRDTAETYQGTQQLRAQLSRTLTENGLVAAAPEGGNG